MKVDISIKINRNKDTLRSRCRVDINGETIFDNYSKTDPYGAGGSSGTLRKISKEERRIILAAVRAWIKSDDVVLKKFPIKSKSLGFSFGGPS